MWILLLEAGLALALLIFIVWWTMAPVRKREQPARPDVIKRGKDDADGAS